MIFNWLRNQSRNAVLAGVGDAVRELGAPVDGNDPLAALQAHVAGTLALPSPAAEAPAVEAPTASRRKRGE